MTKSLLMIVLALPPVSQAAAQSSATPQLPPSTIQSRQLPLKGAASANGCAAYGPGFVKVQGTDSCVKISGALSVDGTARR